MATSTGCGLIQSAFCWRPFPTGGGCDPAFACDGCDEGCGPTCGPTCGPRPVRPVAYAPRRACAVADCDPCGEPECGRPCRGTPCRSCGPCGDACADPCGGGGYGRCWHRGPLSCVFALLMGNGWWSPCCGERYWGDFYSDPPDCWDPCDGCGNYTGGGCQSCGGYSPEYGGDNSGGCRNCSGGGNAGNFEGYARSPTRDRVVDRDTTVVRQNTVPHSNNRVVTSPRSASQPRKASRPQYAM